MTEVIKFLYRKMQLNMYKNHLKEKRPDKKKFNKLGKSIMKIRILKIDLHLKNITLIN
jgi:hypothetical protein